MLIMRTRKRFAFTGVKHSFTDLQGTMITLVIKQEHEDIWMTALHMQEAFGLITKQRTVFCLTQTTRPLDLAKAQNRQCEHSIVRASVQ